MDLALYHYRRASEYSRRARAKATRAADRLALRAAALREARIAWALTADRTPRVRRECAGLLRALLREAGEHCEADRFGRWVDRWPENMEAE